MPNNLEWEEQPIEEYVHAGVVAHYLAYDEETDERWDIVIAAPRNAMLTAEIIVDRDIDNLWSDNYHISHAPVGDSIPDFILYVQDKAITNAEERRSMRRASELEPPGPGPYCKTVLADKTPQEYTGEHHGWELTMHEWINSTDVLRREFYWDVSGRRYWAVIVHDRDTNRFESAQLFVEGPGGRGGAITDCREILMKKGEAAILKFLAKDAVRNAEMAR